MSRNLTRLRPLVLPILLLALVLVYLMPFIRTPTGREALDGHDLIYQQYPLLSLIFDNVRDGHGLPLWNPYQYAGQSTVANPQSTLFYPLAWILVPLGVPRGVGWLVVLHLWIGAWGMMLFARALGASQAGGFVGGLVYAFSALMGAHLGAGHLNYVLCAAWLPWIAAAYLWSVARRHWFLVSLPGVAAMGMCVLSGYPPLFYFSLIWLGALWIYVSLSARSARRMVALRSMRPLLVIVAGGIVLGAALLLPAGEFTLRSTRTQAASLQFSNSYAMPAGQLFTLVFPNMFGQPRLPDLGYWGLPFYEELTAYVGILPLIAFFVVRRHPASILLSIFFLIGLVVSLGIDGGLFPSLYWLLPGYSIFRVPSRALYFVVVAAAGMMALLITDLASFNHEDRGQVLRPALRRILPLLGAFAALASLYFLANFTIHSTDQNPPWRVLYSGNVIGLALIAVIASWIALRVWLNVESGRRASFSARTAVILTTLVLLIDLWHISGPQVTVSAIDIPPQWKALQQVVPGSPDFRVMTVPNEITWQASGTYTGHLNAGGYDPLVSDAYQRLLDATAYNPTSPVARLLGVRYVVSDKPYDASNLPGKDKLTLLANQDGWYVYEVSDPLPRVFIASQTLVLDDEAARQQMASGAVNLATIAITDHAIACAASGDTTPSPAKITAYTPNLVQIDAGGPGLLTLSDSYDPNWTVTVDGVSADLLRVDTALRGVCLPAGAHHVEFQYRPLSFFAGVAISLAGWLALALVGAIVLLRHLRTKPAETQSGTSPLTN